MSKITTPAKLRARREAVGRSDSVMPRTALPRGSQPDLEPVALAGGQFRIGSDQHYPEEGPAHLVTVAPFAIDPCPVTNADYARFVEATGYRTVAERPLDAAAFPGVSVDALAPGSMVFRKTGSAVGLRDFRRWWAWTRDAYWRCPEGLGSSIERRWDHPVVHIAFEDAEAYAQWAGKELPTEAEWEFAARGGLDGAEYAWGAEFAPGGRMMANTWWGHFPYQRLRNKGYDRTSPVGTFPPNGYGLFDMIGNVWEWTVDWYAPQHKYDGGMTCCGPLAPDDAAMTASLDPAQPAVRVPRRVVKGGSFLCSPSYCRRYRPAARHAQMIDSGMSHIGFRCVSRRPVNIKGSARHHG